MKSNQTNIFAAMDTGNIKPKVFWRKPTTASKRHSVKTFVQGENEPHSEAQAHHSEMATRGLKPPFNRLE